MRPSTRLAACGSLSSVVSCCQVRVVSVSGVCRSGCVSGKKIKKRREGKFFYRVGKGQALLQVLVCGGGFCGTANVLDPVRLLSFFLRIQTVLSQ